VMRGLYQSDYKHGRGFTSADWWNAVSAAANGKPFAQFNARYIDGREPFPWDSILPLAGMRTRQERVPRLGVMTQPDPTGVMVANVQEGSSAANAGVKPGDYLISVGDIPVEDQQFGAKMRAKYGASVEGSALQIKVRDVVLEADPAAKPKAVKIRNGIVKGTTG